MGVTAEPLAEDQLIAKLRASSLNHHPPTALLAGYHQLKLARVEIGEGGPVCDADTVTSRQTMRRLSA